MRPFLAIGATLLACGTVTAAAPQRSGNALTITRASLAPSATFTVTQTITPQKGETITRVYKVEVKGNKARADFDDPTAGTLRYLTNDKGVYTYLSTTQTAVKQSLKPGVEEALKLVFSQVRGQLRGAKKVGEAVVSGQKTAVYKAADGTLIYWGLQPGYRLPVKVEQNFAGTKTVVLVSAIRLNVPVANTRFEIPAGTRIESGGASPALPSVP